MPVQCNLIPLVWVGHSRGSGFHLGCIDAFDSEVNMEKTKVGALQVGSLQQHLKDRGELLSSLVSCLQQLLSYVYIIYMYTDCIRIFIIF